MNPSADSPENRIALFQRKQVRRTIHNNEWWFVMTDVIFALTDSINPSDYLKKMRKRDPLLAAAFKGGDKLSPPLHSLSKRKGASNTFNAGTPKAFSASSNPFPARKLNPSNAGSPRSATSEFKKLKIPSWPPNALAPSTKPRATPTTGSRNACAPSPSATSSPRNGKSAALKNSANTPSSPPRFPKPPSASLFPCSMKPPTTEIARSRDTQGFAENKHAARQGGSVAGHARKELEKKTGRKVVTSDNYLALAPAKPKRKSPARKKLKTD